MTAIQKLAAFLALNFWDCVSTLYLVSHGFVESNPAMGWALSYGSGWFVTCKMGLATIFGLGVAIYKPALFRFLLAFFAGLGLYQLGACLLH